MMGLYSILTFIAGIFFFFIYVSLFILSNNNIRKSIIDMGIPSKIITHAWWICVVIAVICAFTANIVDPQDPYPIHKSIIVDEVYDCSYNEIYQCRHTGDYQIRNLSEKDKWYFTYNKTMFDYLFKGNVYCIRLANDNPGSQEIGGLC